MQNWTHKVVHLARGMQGQWFRLGCEGTFATETEARRYADQRTAELRTDGVHGHRIEVHARKGGLVVGCTV